ncbi:MAG: DUF72 domain-containing protein [Candidatus Diapherotrites archaeon]|nr:DUF72 domain-containing protein [Candidatus Diapherotrites archaeon]
MKLFVGCSGWFYWHWKGKFYPSKMKPNKWLEFYAKKFNAVEVNSSFYHWPKEANLKRWAKVVPNEFRFVLKANKQITHIKKLQNVKKLVREFCGIASSLGEQLGCVLFQMPPSYKFSEKNLEKLKVIPEGSAIEFRHSSWFEEENFKIVKENLKQNKQIFCIADAPRFPLLFVKTCRDVYIRFHGRQRWYAYNYSKAELEEVAKAIKKLKTARVFAFFNNDYNAYAPKNALELKKIWQKI